MSNLAKLEQQNVVGGGLAIRTMDDLNRMSKLLSTSGFFSDATSAAQCGVKVLAGAEMGFGAFASMTGIHIIGGKPSIGGGLMAAKIKSDPRYNYRFKEHTDKACEIEFFEVWEGKLTSMGTSRFTIQDAQNATVWNKKKNAFVPLTENNPNWKSYPRNMLFNRAISNGVRWYCPDIFHTTVYTPEELGAETDPEGNYIEAEAVEVTQPQVEVQSDWQQSSNNGNSYDKSSDTRPITDAQLKRLKAISSKHGWKDDAEAGKALIKEFGFESSSDITRNVYEPICEWLEKGPEAYRKAHDMNPTLDIPGMDVEDTEPLGETEYPHGYGTDD